MPGFMVLDRFVVGWRGFQGVLIRLIRVLLIVGNPLDVNRQDGQTSKSDIGEVKTEWKVEQADFVFVGGSHERIVHRKCHNEE